MNQANTNKTGRLRLVLDVEYDLEDEHIEGMRQHLEEQIRSGINRGMLSGDTSATVNEHSFSITEIPDETDPISMLIQMGSSHVEDIESGIQEGIYDADENQDFDAKKAALHTVTVLQGRIAACLDACAGVPTDTLQQMGTGAMQRNRDRAYVDRMLYADMRSALVAIVEDEGHVPDLDEAKRLIQATQADDTGRPAGSLVKFVQQVANLQKWGDGAGEDETDEPSDGMEDSHSCLMDLIDQARTILLPA